MREIEA